MDRPPPRWDVLIDVYANAIRELVALNDPHVDSFIRELTSLYGRAILEQGLLDRSAARSAHSR